MMPMNNSDHSSKTEIEDIFSSVDKISEPEPISVNPAAPPSDKEEEIVAKEKRKISWIMISTAIAAVILIIISGVLFYLKRNPMENENINGAVIVNNTNIFENINRITTANVNLNKNRNINIPVNANAPIYKDTDHDGLSDNAEKDYGTNPKKIDTDDDGLSDREEIKVYLTDPNNPDTDGDGYLDGGEVKNGYNPNGAGKLSDAIK